VHSNKLLSVPLQYSTCLRFYKVYKLKFIVVIRQDQLTRSDYRDYNSNIHQFVRSTVLVVLNIKTNCLILFFDRKTNRQIRTRRIIFFKLFHFVH